MVMNGCVGLKTVVDRQCGGWEAVSKVVPRVTPEGFGSGVIRF